MEIKKEMKETDLIEKISEQLPWFFQCVYESNYTYKHGMTDPLKQMKDELNSSKAKTMDELSLSFNTNIYKDLVKIVNLMDKIDKKIEGLVK
jgi:hypothetical protein